MTYWKMSRPRPSRIFQPVSVTIERSWIVLSNETSKLMPPTAAPWLDLQQEPLKLLAWSFSLPSLFSEVMSLTLTLVSRRPWLAAIPSMQFHEVAGLVVMTDIRVGDRDLRCPAQIWDKQRIERHPALVLLEFIVPLEQGAQASLRPVRNGLERHGLCVRFGSSTSASAVDPARW